jgi:hypothetical protein
MKKADRFFDFYLPDFIDIKLFESSNPTEMDYLLFGIYKLILEKFFKFKEKKRVICRVSLGVTFLLTQK